VVFFSSRGPDAALSLYSLLKLDLFSSGAGYELISFPPGRYASALPSYIVDPLIGILS